MRGKEKNNEAYRKHSVISFIICEVLADVAAVALILLGRTGAERYGSASVPATDYTTDAGRKTPRRLIRTETEKIAALPLNRQKRFRYAVPAG